MEPKKEHTVREENGTRVERSTNDDPDAHIHSEEIKIERHNGGDEKPSPEDQDAESSPFFKPSWSAPADRAQMWMVT
jgi:hypothetical protein